jgi:hypothetical protein
MHETKIDPHYVQTLIKAQKSLCGVVVGYYVGNLEGSEIEFYFLLYFLPLGNHGGSHQSCRSCQNARPGLANHVSPTRRAARPQSLTRGPLGR